MSIPTQIPAPEPDDVARGLAEIERYTAAHAPTLPVPTPPAEVEPLDQDIPEGETRRVRDLRARVAEAHRLVELQEDDAPLLVDTSRVRRRRQKVAEAARLYRLAQDPSALAWRDARVRRITTAMAMTAATIALSVSSIGVQRSVSEGLGLEDGSPAWWAAFGVEPALSLPLLAAVGVQAYSAMRGRVIDRKSAEGRKLFKVEALLLGLTLLLNCWPAFAGIVELDVLPLIVHSLGPVAAVTAIWVLPTLWAVLAVLPVPGGTGPEYSANAAAGGAGEYTRYTPGGVDIEALADRVRQMIDEGELAASPGVHKIRKALGVGTDIAREVQQALAGGAS